jgi:hypothetical protein
VQAKGKLHTDIYECFDGDSEEQAKLKKQLFQTLMRYGSPLFKDMIEARKFFDQVPPANLATYSVWLCIGFIILSSMACLKTGMAWKSCRTSDRFKNGKTKSIMTTTIKYTFTPNWKLFIQFHTSHFKSLSAKNPATTWFFKINISDY